MKRLDVISILKLEDAGIIDTKDRKILIALSEDSTLGKRQLAKHIGLCPTAAQRRLQKIRRLLKAALCVEPY